MDIIPLHRRLPPAEVLTEANRYVRAIQKMREATRNAKDFYNNPQGPILHAIQKFQDFPVSASEWDTQHLIRFEIVVFLGQVSTQLFPFEYLLKDDDPTMMALVTDGFFFPDASTIGNGTWDRTKLHHFFYLTMMLLLRGGDRTQTPRHSPQHREIRPRATKDYAREQILRMLNSGPETLSSVSSADSSVSSTSTDQSYRQPNKGPRETLSFQLLHQFLSYLGTIEMNSNPSHPVWIAW
jgi:hypothetical protein